MEDEIKKDDNVVVEPKTDVIETDETNEKVETKKDDIKTDDTFKFDKDTYLAMKSEMEEMQDNIDKFDLDSIKKGLREEIEQENIAKAQSDFRGSISDDIKSRIKDEMKLDVETLDFNVLESIVKMLDGKTVIVEPKENNQILKSNNDLAIEKNKTDDEIFGDITKKYKKKNTIRRN